MVIIISGPDDAHVPFVTKNLHNSHIIIDGWDVLDQQTLTYDFDGRQVYVRYNDRRLKDVTGIWLRRPRSFSAGLSHPVAARHAEYSRNAINHHLEQLYALF